VFSIIRTLWIGVGPWMRVQMSDMPVAAQLCVCLGVGCMLNDAVIGVRLRKSQERIITAPVIVVVSLYLADLDPYPDADRTGAERIMAIQSLGAAVQNFLLHIYARGYDAGWMCAPLFCADIVRDVLDLPDAFIPHAMLPVGRAAADPVRRPRRPVDELIASWE